MSVARCREINARLRAAGITVHEWPGWETRGNGQSSAYEGAIVHHTATAFGSAPAVLVNGRPDLAGPLCNYAGNADGSVTVIAAHPANHAGASGGRATGPLPVTSLFNKRVLGLEIVYPGTVPMRAAQYRTAAIWSRIAVDVCGYGDIQRARAHAETSITGKWDPGEAPSRTINMAAFRAAALTRPEDDMTPEELLDYKIARQGSSLGGATSLRAVVANFDQAAEGDAKRDAAILAAASKVDAVSQKVDAVTAGIPAAVQRGLADYLTAHPPTVKIDVDYVALAKAMNDEADRRARDNDPATGPRS